MKPIEEMTFLELLLEFEDNSIKLAALVGDGNFRGNPEYRRRARWHEAIITEAQRRDELAQKAQETR